MLMTSLYALLSVSLLSAIGLSCVFALSMRQSTLDKMVSYLVALAAGAMLGNAAFHLIPETFEHAASPATAGLLLLIGILGCYGLEKWLNLRCNGAHGGCELRKSKHTHGHEHSHGHAHGHDHDDHAEEQLGGCGNRSHNLRAGHDHSGGHGHLHRAEYIHPTGWMSLFSHSIHNFGDGVLIAVAYMTSPAVGLATTLAIVLHEIPMEFGEFGVLINAGFKRKSALFVNLISGVVALLGTAFTLFLGSEIPGIDTVLTPIGAGCVLYIATCGLIPQLQKETCARKSRTQFLILLAGVAVMYAVSLLHGA